jgi:hypothetical protein
MPRWGIRKAEIQKHNLINVLICAIIVPLVGCSRSERVPRIVTSAGVAPGSVLIDILQSGTPEWYWQYEVVPEKGTVRCVKREIFLDYQHEDLPTEYIQPPVGATGCDETRQAVSPDGKLRAFCSDGWNYGYYHHLSVTDASGEVLFVWNPGNRLISGFAWAPNSNSLGILNKTERYGMWPLELLSAIAGHPVPHHTIFLDFLDVKTGKATEFQIRANVVNAFSRMLAWVDQPRGNQDRKQSSP